MEWKSKPKPKEGDKKEKVKFAIFPTRIQDKWIWLEKYIKVYEYKKFLYFHDVVVSEGIFMEKFYTDIDVAIGWCEIDKKRIIKQNKDAQ